MKNSKPLNLPEIDPDDPQHKIVIDWVQFEKLCQMVATEIEIAGWFGCSVDTLARKVKEHYGVTFKEIHKTKSSAGKISLRRTQWKIALGEVNALNEEGNVYTRPPDKGMCIWLGKQHLGQKERTEIDENRTYRARVVDDEEGEE